jgi:hypothetical protein
LERLYHYTFSNRISEAHHVQILSCFNLGASVWFTICPFFPTFRISFQGFFHRTSNMTWISSSLNFQVSFNVCAHWIDLMVFIFYVVFIIMSAHEPMICDTFVTIMWNVGFHVQQKQLNAFLSIMFNSFHWWVDNMFTKDDICTLIDIVITDPTWVDLFPWSCATQEFVTSDAAQAKEMSYRDRHPTNQFLLLTIEIFGCLCKQAYVFLHDCANAIWSLKNPKAFHLSIFITFLHQKISITL